MQHSDIKSSDCPWTFYVYVAQTKSSCKCLQHRITIGKYTIGKYVLKALGSTALTEDECRLVTALLDVPLEDWRAHTGDNSHALQDFLEHACMHNVKMLAQQMVAYQQLQLQSTAGDWMFQDHPFMTL